MTTSLHRDVSGWATRLNAEDAARYTGSGVWRNVTLAENARRQAEQHAQRIAVIEGNRSASFGTLMAQANQLAAAFQALGLRAGDVISFQLPNWIETMVINTAACIAGLVVNPIVPIYREAEVRYILRDARPKLFFIPEQFRNFDYPGMVARLRAEVPGLLESVVIRGGAPGCIEYEQLLASGAGRSPVWRKSDPNAVKLVLYTSGPTGSPKGVLHSHNTIMAEIEAVIAFWGITSADVVLMPSPVTHITGYLKAEETLEAFDADGYFHTGDLGYYVDGDCLSVSGRKKDLIIRGGENISPKEIEDLLHIHPAIKETAVVAMPHPRLGEGVCAFVIPSRVKLSTSPRSPLFWRKLDSRGRNSPSTWRSWMTCRAPHRVRCRKTCCGSASWRSSPLISDGSEAKRRGD